MPEDNTVNPKDQNENTEIVQTEVLTPEVEVLPNDETREPEKDFFIAEEYGDSFAALGTAILEAHDLKKKRRALDEYNKTLETLKLAYADRVDIAENYDSIVAEQERVKTSTLASISDCEAKSRSIDAQIAEANDELANLKRAQDEAIKPYEDELNRRDAMLRSAKDEYKQVRSQRDSLDLFDESHEAGELDSGVHDQIVDDVESKYEAAKEARRAAQKSLDAQVKSNKADQKVILDAIKKLNNEKGKIAKQAAELQTRVDKANERIAFCKHVIEHPEQTQAMRERIAENEKTSANMAEQISQLSEVHSKSVLASSKARTVVIVAAVAIVIVAILVIYLANR